MMCVASLFFLSKFPPFPSISNISLPIFEIFEIPCVPFRTMPSFARLRHLRCPISSWHLFFLAIFVLLLLLCAHQRLLLGSEGNDEEEKADEEPPEENISNNAPGDGGEEGHNGISDRRRIRRRQLKPARIEFFGHLLPMRDYVSAEQFAALRKLHSHYKQLRANKTRTIGMDYADFFMPGEVDMDRLDSDSLKRLQMRAIVDAMAESGGAWVVEQIRGVLRRQAELREAKAQSESRHELQTDAWDVCLGEQDTVCNGHLLLGHHATPPLLCACSLTPQHSDPPPPPCSALLRIRDVSAKVLTIVLLFPLPELFGSHSSLPHLSDLFLAHWMALSLHHSIRWDQVLLLRKQCVDERFFALQFAFLKKTISNELTGVTDQDLLDISDEKILAGRALWTDQAVMERAFAEQIDYLLPEAMAESAYFRKEVAQLGVRPCRAPWDYLSFLRCHPLALLFLASGSVLALGFPLGTFRFYHQLMSGAENRRRKNRAERRRMMGGGRGALPEAQLQQVVQQQQSIPMIPLGQQLASSAGGPVLAY